MYHHTHDQRSIQVIVAWWWLYTHPKSTTYSHTKHDVCPERYQLHSELQHPFSPNSAYNQMSIVRTMRESEWNRFEKV